MECLKVENNNKENFPENNYDFNEIPVKNIKETKLNSENNGKQKLKSKFSYKDENNKKEDLQNFNVEENLKTNYYTYDPKNQNIFHVNYSEESFDEEIKENKNKNENRFDITKLKEKENKINNNGNKIENNFKKVKEDTYLTADSFNRKNKTRLDIVSDFEKDNFRSEKFERQRKSLDFKNLRNLITKKITTKNEHKQLNKIIGDVNDVPPFWIGIGLQINPISNKKTIAFIQEYYDANSNSNLRYKSNTFREETPLNYNNFNNNIDGIEKNEAYTVRTGGDIMNKIDSNKFEMNGNELIPKNNFRRVSNCESYYEFNNNLNLNNLDQNNKNEKIPKIYNEYIKNEINHQTSPKNNYNSNIRMSTLSNHNEDFVISKENLSQKGFLKIDTNNQSVIKLPENYWTKDQDKKILVDLINEIPNAKWDKIKVDTHIKIHKKKIENNPSILIKTVAIINDFTMEEIFNAIANVEIRKKWDTLFSEFRIVEENKEEKSEVLYMALKSPFVLVERREFVQKRKIWHNFPDSNSVCIHFKSIDHPACPLNKKIVRAHTYISGYFIKTESINPMRCSVHIVSQTDAKGKIPVWIVNKVSQTAPNDWVNNLIKGCKMVREKKLNN